MYLRQIKRPKGIYLAIQESVYDNSSRQSRTKTVESLGYLEDLRKKYPDPIAHFQQVVAEMNEERRANSAVSVSIDLSSQLEKGRHNLKNVGFSPN